MKKVLLLLLCLTLPAMGAMAYRSVLIKGGLVYDGSTAEPFEADVFVFGDRISKVGDCSDQKPDTVINAQGMVVCPGFIDPHSHVNGNMVKSKTRYNKGYLSMGVTTVICGMCGGGPVPISEQAKKLVEQEMGTNIAYFIGLGSVRRHVMGGADRVPDAEEMDKMKALIKSAMEWGAFGVSSGLIYTPGCFASTEELIELTKVIAPYGGIYTTHMRNEGNDVLKSIEETLRIGREAGVQLNISHLKSTSKMKGHSAEVIDAIAKARSEGVKITADQYPYNASSTSLVASVLPKWAATAGRSGYLRMFDDPDTLQMIKDKIKANIGSKGGSNMLFSNYCKDKEIRGLTLAQIAEKWRMNPVEATVRILRRSAPSVVKFTMDEEDVRNYMSQPWVMTCTDGSIGGHPRSFSTYVWKIENYVLKEKVLTLGEMIHRSSGLVAKTYALPSRGFVREGYYADLLVFRPEDLKANADYVNPRELATGYKMVMVNGRIAVLDSKPTEALAGRIIKKGGL